MPINCYLSGARVGAWPDFEPRTLSLPDGSEAYVRAHPHMWVLMDRLAAVGFTEARLVAIAWLAQLESGRTFEQSLAVTVVLALKCEQDTV